MFRKYFMANRNIQINYYNGSGYDVLYPETVMNQVGGLQDSLNTKLNLSGGTMTGDLLLNKDPTSNLMAATKQYVDNLIANNGLKYESLSIQKGLGVTFVEFQSSFSNVKMAFIYFYQRDNFITGTGLAFICNNISYDASFNSSSTWVGQGASVNIINGNKIKVSGLLNNEAITVYCAILG